MIKRFSQPLLLTLFVLIVSAPITLPYFHSGYFPTHDGEWAVVRMADMFRSLRDHQFPVRWSGYLNFQYGYPLFNFVYPMPYYLGTLIHFLHFGFIKSVKFMFAMSVFFSAFGMFLLSRQFWKSTIAGGVSTILYIYLPYRIVDLYVRGSIGESVSLALFPFLFFLILKITEKQRLIYSLTGAVFFACLIGTHNIMSVLFTPLMLCLMVEEYMKEKKVFQSYCIFLGLGIGLSAFFWLPALAEKHLILLSQIPIANRNLYFVHLKQLISMPWGYGTPTEPHAFPYEVGIPHSISFIAVIFLFFFSAKNTKVSYDQKMSIVLLCIVLVIAMIFMLFPFTAAIWKSVPLLKEINYPWTLLAPIGFLIALISGFLGKKKHFQVFGVLLAAAAVVLYLPFAHPVYYTYQPDSYYLTNQATTTSSSELMPITVKKFPTRAPIEKVSVIQGQAVISNVLASSTRINFLATSRELTHVRINTLYYPGWQVTIDGHVTPVLDNNTYGVMEIVIPAGTHMIAAQLHETSLRLLADAISLVSLIMLITLCVSSILFRKVYAK